MKKEGVLFSNVITYAPYTVSSLHTTFTGMYGLDNGVNGYTKSDHYDSKNCICLPEYLQKNGYYTQGYGYSRICFPNLGFDKLQFVEEKEEKDVTQSHLSVLKECFSKEKPFFSFLHYGEIHHSVMKDVVKKYTIDDDQFFGKFDQNKERYKNYAHEAGNYVETLYNYINSQDPENTLIIFFTDHGGSVGEKKGELCYGVYTYDYTIKTWFYFIQPKLLPKNKEFKQQIRNKDVLPTILELLNIKPLKKYKKIKGDSLMPVINNLETDDREAFSETGGLTGPSPSPNAHNVHSYRDGEWKLIFQSTNNKVELYNIVDDPEENVNLLKSHQGKVDELWDKIFPLLP